MISSKRSFVLWSQQSELYITAHPTNHIKSGSTDPFSHLDRPPKVTAIIRPIMHA